MRQLGILQALLSGICFGFLGIFGKEAYALGLKSGEFLSFRFLIAALAMGLVLKVFAPHRIAIGKGKALRCAFLGIFGYAVFSSCFFAALEGLSASLTVLLLYTYPVIVTLGAWALFREKPTPIQLVALPIVAVGLAALVWGELEVRSTFSLLLGFLSAVFYSVYILASSRWLKGVDSFGATFYVMLAAGLTVSVFHLRPSTFPIPPDGWLVVSGAAILSTLLAMSLFLAALGKLGNSQASLLSTAEPVTGVALAALFLGERPMPLQWVGGALIVGGMLLVGYSQRQGRRQASQG